MIVPDWTCEGSLEKAKRDALIAAIRWCDGNLVAVAGRLRIGRSTVYRMIQDLSVDLKNLPMESASSRRGGRLVQVDGELFMVT